LNFPCRHGWIRAGGPGVDPMSCPRLARALGLHGRPKESRWEVLPTARCRRALWVVEAWSHLAVGETVLGGRGNSYCRRSRARLRQLGSSLCPQTLASLEHGSASARGLSVWLLRSRHGGGMEASGVTSARGYPTFCARKVSSEQSVCFPRKRPGDFPRKVNGPALPPCRQPALSCGRDAHVP
jgi:hypothetical protein